MELNFGGMIPVSTVDWHGRSVSVIFFNGCPLRCPYCQNHALIEASNPVDIEEIEKKIIDSKSFISAVVFSGGEPTMQYESLEKLLKFTKEQGMLAGIETNGYYPERLERLVREKLVDKIFLDIKASPEKYKEITGGIEDAGERALRCLDIRGVPVEVRTTVFRSFIDILEIACYLRGYDHTYVIQQGIPENAKDEVIRKEKRLTREELTDLARSVSFLKDVRIRTREKGEEKITLI